MQNQNSNDQVASSSSKEDIENQFTKLQAKYNLKTPEQIQMRIIWTHLKQLTINAFGEDPKNKTILDTYDKQWRLCELIEEFNEQDYSNTLVKKVILNLWYQRLKH